MKTAIPTTVELSSRIFLIAPKERTSKADSRIIKQSPCHSHTSPEMKRSMPIISPLRSLNITLRITSQRKMQAIHAFNEINGISRNARNLAFVILVSNERAFLSEKSNYILCQTERTLRRWQPKGHKFRDDSTGGQFPWNTMAPR